jgi:hypothetical protein
MADLERDRVALEIGMSLVAGVGGWLIGIWKWGRASARHEQKVKEDYDGKINALREEMRDAMADYNKAADARNDLLVEQFHESFEGIRRQIDDNRLDAERRFLPKDGLTEFRKEYREDMASLMRKIDHITQRADR